MTQTFTWALNRSFAGGGLMCFMKQDQIQDLILRESSQVKRRNVNYSHQLIRIACQQPGSDLMTLSGKQIVTFKTASMVCLVNAYNVFLAEANWQRQ